MNYAIAFVVCALVMGILDFLWLRNALGPVYQRSLGPILAEKPNMTAALIFYLLYLVGVQIFAVRPALAAADWHVATVSGALLGLVAYGTYDLTNLATLKVWSWKVTAIDMAWGAFLTSVTATAGALAVLKLLR